MQPALTEYAQLMHATVGAVSVQHHSVVQHHKNIKT
jgi:hypothetical protein